MKFQNKLTSLQLRWLESDNASSAAGLAAREGCEKIVIWWPNSYGWAITQKWMVSLLYEFQRNFEVRFKELPHYAQVVIFEVEAGGVTYPIAIDRVDSQTLNESVARNISLYFKMQYRTEGYEFENVVPGGFVPADLKIYLHLQKLRALRDHQGFLYDAYGRFGRNFAKSVRGKAVDILNSQDQFSYHGGLGRVCYVESLREAARSKVCVDLPGNGPFCFRLIDYMAIGACIVAYPHHSQFPVPLRDRFNIVYCKEDMSDLNELCAYYASNSQEREAIAQNSRAYFDEYLCKERLALHYIEQILAHIRALKEKKMKA